MNTPESPLNPETLDELLSADFDGELERAAGDMGLTLEQAVTALTATPDAPRRRAELTRARDALAAPVPLAPTDELLLVTTALNRSIPLRAVRDRPRGVWRVLVAVGSAAAVIAGVVALAATHTGSGDSKSSAATAPRPALLPLASPAHGPASLEQSVEFGNVSRPATLQAELAIRLHATTPPPSPAGAGGISPAGPRGATGATGVAGVFGVVNGAAEVPGPQGAQGLHGNEGIVGPVGPTGPAGGTGTEGAVGAQGPLGPAPAGIAASAGVGTKRLAGPQGVTGSPDLDHSAVDGLGVPSTPAAEPANGTRKSAATGVDRVQVCIAIIRATERLTTAPVLAGTGTYAGREVVVAVFARGQVFAAYVMAASNCTLATLALVPGGGG